MRAGFEVTKKMTKITKKVDFRIHFALSSCATALECGPELPPAARLLIIEAMQLLLDADNHIVERMPEDGSLH